MSVFDLLCLYFLVLGGIEFFYPAIPKQYICILAVFPAFFFTAFRDVSVGCDTASYLRTFELISNKNSLLEAFAYSRMEIGYVSLIYYFSHMGMSFLQCQIVLTLFFYVSFYLFVVKFVPNIGLSFFIFLTLKMMFGPMNVVRMYMAMAVLLLSLPSLEKKQIARFLGIVLVATLIHKTAIFFSLLYPLTYCHLTKKKTYLLFAVAAFLGILGKGLFAQIVQLLGLYDGYLGGKYFDSDGKSAMFLILAIDVLLYLFLLYNNNKEEPKSAAIVKDCDNVKKICNSAIVLIICLDLIGLSNGIMGRISGYFMFSWLVLIPMSIMRQKNKIAALMSLIIIMICLFVQYEVVMIYRPNWHCVEPYSFCFGELF